MSFRKYAAVAVCACATGYLLRSAPDKALIGNASRYEFEQVDNWPAAMHRIDRKSGEIIFCWVYQGAPQRIVLIERNWRSVEPPKFEDTFPELNAIDRKRKGDVFDRIALEDPLGDPGASNDPYKGLGIEDPH